MANPTPAKQAAVRIGAERAGPGERGPTGAGASSTAREEGRERVVVWPCREAWYYLAVTLVVAAGAVMRQINLLIFVFGLLLAPLVVSWPTARANLRRLRVRRRLPTAARVGDDLDLEYELSAERRPVWGVTLRDAAVLASGEGGDPLRVEACLFAARVGPGEATRLRSTGRLMERGRYRFGPVQVVSRFPLGLFEARFTTGTTETLVVQPRTGRLSPRWRRLVGAPDQGRRRPRRRAGGAEGDFAGLRDWRTGDARRLIHWRSSARRDQLVVRQFDQAENDDLALVLDLWEPAAPEPLDLEYVELAVSLTATLVLELGRTGDGRFFLAVGAAKEAGSGPAWQGGKTSAGLVTAAMTTLAVARAGERPAVDEALRLAAEHTAPGTTTLVVSTRDDPGGRAATEDRPRRWLNVRSTLASEVFQAR